VERSFRQYNAVEPENRLVARGLEKKWEEALAAEEKLKHDYTNFLAEQPLTLTEEEREAIKKLATDIPKLWTASTTISADKQAIERIIVTVQGETEKVAVEIYWAGGYRTATQMIRPVAKLTQLSQYKELLVHVVELNKQGKKTKAIAEILNTEGWHPPKRRETFNGPMIRELLAKTNLAKNCRQAKIVAERAPDEWTLNELARKLNMSHVTLYSWLKKGKLSARRVIIESKPIWLIQAAKEEITRLKALQNAPRKWACFSRVKSIENGNTEEN
jgi:hypothetical protein